MATLQQLRRYTKPVILATLTFWAVIPWICHSNCHFTSLYVLPVSLWPVKLLISQEIWFRSKSSRFEECNTAPGPRLCINLNSAGVLVSLWHLTSLPFYPHFSHKKTTRISRKFTWAHGRGRPEHKSEPKTGFNGANWSTILRRKKTYFNLYAFFVIYFREFVLQIVSKMFLVRMFNPRPV